MIVLRALGLAIFDARGVDELCSEKIYFWTFLNLTLWLFCLASAWAHRGLFEVEQVKPPTSSVPVPTLTRAT